MTGNKALFQIPAHHPFLETLAKGILTRADNDQFQLATWNVHLPNQRSCQALKEIFAQLSDRKTSLLPKISPLSALQPDVPLSQKPLSLERRTLLLSLLVQKAMPEQTDATQLLETTNKLCNILDQAHAHYVNWDQLNDFIPEQLAQHWQSSATFLDILHTHWPAILEQENALDPELHRTRSIEGVINQWQHQDLTGPTIIAGSTASIPSTARLMQALMNQPQGFVVLPTILAAPLAEDYSLTHPHYNLKRFVSDLDIPTTNLPHWCAPTHEESRAGFYRSHLFLNAYKPHKRQEESDIIFALQNLSFIEAQTQQEEARAIALKMRMNLEIPNHKTVLVTPDQQLAAKVKAELKRWNIHIDDTADHNLSKTPAGLFMKLLLELGERDFNAATLLSFLTHPLTKVEDRDQTRHFAHFLDQHWLRTPDAPRTMAELVSKAEAYENAELINWLQTLSDALHPLTELQQSTFTHAYRIHTEVALSLCTDLSEFEGGEAVLSFMKSFEEAPLNVVDSCLSYKDIFTYFLDAQPYRREDVYHPRLQILGLLEGRLLNADTVILGGLNEGVWPPDASPCPWLSEAMREAIGLPLAQRRVGLSAHDFGHLFSRNKVLLTRSINVNSSPTIPARWLTQLQISLQHHALHLPKDGILRQYTKALVNQEEHTPLATPAPCPNLAARPTRLSVTDIVTWQRNPYEFYARKILNLIPLDPLNGPADQRLFGIIVHKTIELMLKSAKPPMPDLFMDIAQQQISPYTSDILIRSFWIPKLQRMAEWVCETLATRVATVRHVFSELPGQLKLGTHTLTAKADYIEEYSDGLSIIDFKTGTVPSTSKVESGQAPQLAVEAYILAEGGFKISGPILSLEYWSLKDSDKHKKIHQISKNINDIHKTTRDGISDLLTHFNDPATTYTALYDESTFQNPYRYLSRQEEWVLLSLDIKMENAA